MNDLPNRLRDWDLAVRQLVEQAEARLAEGNALGGLAAVEGADDDAVDDSGARVELVRLAEQDEQVGVEAIPNTGLLPVPQAAVGGASGAAEFGRYVLPAGAAGQDEPYSRAIQRRIR